MEALDTNTLVLFVTFAVPGFLSMKVYGLFHAVEDVGLKDSILEAIAFGIVNFALMFWSVRFLLDPTIFVSSPWVAYGLVVLVFFISPIIWPTLLHFILEFLAQKRMILQRNKTSWDDFFVRREPAWIIVHFSDGRKIGGWYGENSYASLYPNSGHIYLEEVWRLDAEGRFLEKVQATKGIVLRPDDYSFVELFQAKGNAK